MTASEIVSKALEEAGSTDNGGDDENAIVTIERVFHIDKDVQDELGHEPDEPEGATTPPDSISGNGEDSDIDYVTLFTQHMAEDAAPQTDFTQKPELTPAQKRHDTPLEDCRAKNPLYCRYHGEKAMQANLEQAFAKAGVTLKGLSVTKERHGDFRIKVSIPKKQTKKANAVLDSIGTWPGFHEITADDRRKTEQQIGRQDLHVVARSDYENDPQVKLDEYIDTVVRDFANGDDIPTSDFIALLNAKKKADDSWEALNASPADETANDAYVKDRRACEDIYHRCAAMVTMKDIKDYEQANALWTALQSAKQSADATGSSEALREKVNAVKAKYGIKQFKGATLNGLDGVSEWRNTNRELSLAESARFKYLLAYQEGIDAATSAITDLQKVRWALHGLKFSTENYVRAIADADNVANRVIKSIEEYAQQNDIKPVA